MKYVVIIYYVLVKEGKEIESLNIKENIDCLLYTSDAADEL